MPAIGAIISGGAQIVGGLVQGGGVPLTRFGKVLAALAKSRNLPDADRWAREHEKAIDDGEDQINWSQPGRSGIPGSLLIEEVWAERIARMIAELPPPALTQSEWQQFANTDRGGNALRRGLIPPKSILPPRVPVYGIPGSPSGEPPMYMLPTQNVTAQDPILIYVAIGAALFFLL